MGALTPVQAAKAKLIALADEQYAWAKDWDWDRLSRGCGGQIEHTRALIQGNDFSKKLDQVLTAAKKKLAKEYVMNPNSALEPADDDAGARSMSRGEISLISST
jgi:hypothetical protein